MGSIVQIQMETETTIEAVEIMNGELIDVLAEVAQHHRTQGATSDPALTIEGESERRLLSRAEGNYLDDDVVLTGSELVNNGSLRRTVTVRGNEAELVVL